MSEQRKKKMKTLNDKREKQHQASMVMADQMLYNTTVKHDHVEGTFLFKEGNEVSFEEIRRALHDVVDGQCAYFFVGLDEECRGNTWKKRDKEPIKAESLMAAKEMPPEATIWLMSRALHMIDDNLRRLSKLHATYILSGGVVDERDLPPEDQISTVSYFAVWADVLSRSETMWRSEREKKNYELGNVPPVPLLLFNLNKDMEKLSSWKRFALFGQNTRAMFRMENDELKNKFKLEAL